MALVVVALVAIIGMFVLGQVLNLYIQALLSNARVSITELVGMRLRKVDVRTVVYSRIRAVKSGLDISTAPLETHFLSGGRVPHVVSAMIAARHSGAELPWEVATAVDLAGHDPLAGVVAMLKDEDSDEQGREAARVLLRFMRSAGASTAGLRVPDGEPRAQLLPLVGAVGEVVEALDPHGRVRIGARAYRASGASPLPVGAIVRVVEAADGGLIVERAG